MTPATATEGSAETELVPALDGLTVIETGTRIASAYATKLMADLGADVIKIEPPGIGDGTRHDGPFADGKPDPERSGLFLYLNTNKSSVTLDLTTPEGMDLLKRLCADADVLVHGGPTSDAPLNEAEIRSINPRLVAALISPFGRTGPYSDHVGYEINSAALGGICGYLGLPGRPLLCPPLSVGQYETGTNAAIAVMAATLGEVGQVIDLAEADCWATVQNGMGVIEFIFGERVFARMGRGVKSGPYPNTILPCKDGLIRLVAMQRREWERFVAVMGDPEWASDPRFSDRVRMNEEHSDEVDAYVTAWMADKTKDEIFRLCRDAAVPFAPIYTLDEVMDDPAYEHWFVDVAHDAAGTLRQFSFPYDLTGSPPEIRKGAPSLGHETASVLERLGVDHDQLADLQARGVC